LQQLQGLQTTKRAKERAERVTVTAAKRAMARKKAMATMKTVVIARARRVTGNTEGSGKRQQSTKHGSGDNRGSRAARKTAAMAAAAVAMVLGTVAMIVMMAITAVAMKLVGAVE
jgi:hypothetical protein